MALPTCTVDAFVGQTRSRALIADLVGRGYGECTQPDEWPPRRTPYFADNGAFKAWTAGRAFDAASWSKHCERVAAHPVAPAFVVVPDKVAAGAESLALSLAWAPRMVGVGPLALVVQDGMTAEMVADVLEPFAVLFVGGSLEWKLATSAAWVRLAHAHGKRCHVGRVGTARRVAWARRIGADSIDSCLPLWSRAKLGGFGRALEGRQGELSL